jgi:Arc/MetJ family transcription regulator
MQTRTNIVLDDKLVAQAMRKAGVSSKKAAVEAALKAFVKKPDYSGLIALVGSGAIDPNYDPKALFLDQPKPLTSKASRA